MLTTSLAGLVQFLPDTILDGRWLFCRLCVVAMRPRLREEDLEELEILCQSFYEYCRKTLLPGHPTKTSPYAIYYLFGVTHTVVDKVLRAVALSFPISLKRFIVLVKSSTKARHRYAESVAINWVFQHAARMCKTMSGVQIPLVRKRSLYCKDGHSIASDRGRYQGFHIASTYSRKTLSDRRIV